MAALDVTDPEPLPDGHPLWRSPGVLVSPHVGGDTSAFTPRAVAPGPRAADLARRRASRCATRGATGGVRSTGTRQRDCPRLADSRCGCRWLTGQTPAMTSTVVAVGTRKGLWLARSEDRQHWSVEGPQFLMREVPSLGFVPRDGGVRLHRGGPVRALGADGDALRRPGRHLAGAARRRGDHLPRGHRGRAGAHLADHGRPARPRRRLGRHRAARAVAQRRRRRRRSSWCAGSGTTRTGRCGARASAAAPSTRSCPTRRTPTACSWP